MEDMQKISEWGKIELDMPVKDSEIVEVAKSLSVMFSSGLTTIEALDILTDQSTGKMKQTLSRVAEKVRAGELLSEAMASESRVFNQLFVGSVRIGESCGTLATNLEHLFNQMDRSMKLKRSIRSAMIYPIIVVTLMLVIGLAVAIFVLPQIAETFASLKTELPWTTRFVIWLAEVLQNYGWFLGFAAVAGGCGLVMLLTNKNTKPFVHPILLKIPILKDFILDLNRAGFCRSLGVLMLNGVPVQEAVETAEQTISNFVFKRAARDIKAKVETGRNLSEIFADHQKLFPKMITHMVSVGERSGGVGKMLQFLSGYYEEKIDTQFKNLSSVIEPILLLFVGIGVAFFAISILAPIYNIASVI